MEKKHTKQEKMDIIVSILRNPKRQREICGKYGIGISTYYKWRNRFFHGGIAGLEGYKTGPRSNRIETENERELKKKLKEYETRISELATELEILKKNES